jgi:hypothetical protein
MPEHLDEETLELYVLGRLPLAEVPRVIGHLSGCSSCQASAAHESQIAIDILSTATPAEIPGIEEWSSAAYRPTETRH